jgi:RNA polymerase sigma factor (sigma-70 family)
MEPARGRVKLGHQHESRQDRLSNAILPQERTAVDGKISTKAVDSSADARDPEFADFVRRIRAGDDQAAEELVNRFESLIRREVRLRISGSQINRAFDSQDVTQSVLANFFVRAATGQFELEHPDQLARLLVTMARNKLVSRVRSERRQIRDIRRVTVDPDALNRMADEQPSPSEIVARRELLERLRKLLSDEEQQIIDLRNQGLGWDEVALQLGGSGQARRMQMSRGIERLTRELGIAE